MAEGGDVPGKKPEVENDSVDVCSMSCCVCIKKTVRTEAVKYCLNCLDFYCEECVKLHDFVPALSKHDVVGIADITRHNTGGNVPPIPTKRCAKHETKLIDMYCKTHNEVGCSTCFALEHNGQCCITMFIPDTLTEIFQADKILQAEKNLSVAVQNLKDELVFRNKGKTELINLKDKATKAMESYIKEIFATVNKLKKNTKASLQKLFTEIDGLIDNQCSEIKLNLSTAEDVLKDAKRVNSDGCNEQQQFICGIKANKANRKCNEINKRLKCPSVQEITFKPHLSCKILFGPLLQHRSLGAFTLEQTTPNKRICQYKIKSNNTVKLNVYGEEHYSCISSSILFPHGTQLLTDIKNHRIKRLLPHQSSVSDHFDLPTGPNTPWSVCVISQHLAAVTLPHRQKVRFVSIGKAMRKARTMKLNFECWCVAYHSGVLYISDHNTVYEYTTTGKQLRQLFMDNPKSKLFPSINSMTVSESGCVLYVADSDKGLIAVDTQKGHKLWEYTAEDLKGATGVCVGDRGSVFVCGQYSNNVLHISESGKKIDEVLTREDGVFAPRSVCFDKDKRALIVTVDDDKILQFFKC